MHTATWVLIRVIAVEGNPCCHFGPEFSSLKFSITVSFSSRWRLYLYMEPTGSSATSVHVQTELLRAKGIGRRRQWKITGTSTLVGCFMILVTFLLWNLAPYIAWVKKICPFLGQSGAVILVLGVQPADACIIRMFAILNLCLGFFLINIYFDTFLVCVAAGTHGCPYVSSYSSPSWAIS